MSTFFQNNFFLYKLSITMADSDLEEKFKAFDLSRDERLQILTLHSIGWSLNKISQHTGATWRQVQYTCQNGQATPVRRSGRPPLLTEA